MIVESHQCRRIIEVRPSHQGFNYQQQRQAVAIARTGDLEWQVGLYQDRELFDNVPRLGMAGSNLGVEAGGFDQLRQRLPSLVRTAARRRR